MKKLLISLLVLVPVGVLTYSYSFVSFILIVAIILSLAVLIPAGLIRMFRKELNRNWFEVPFLSMGVCMAGILIGLLRPFEPALTISGNASKDLAYAYKTDQDDRKTLKTYLGFRSEIQARDSMRIAQVKKLYDANQIHKPLEKFHAAFVLHHSKDSALYQIAHKLAKSAASADEFKDTFQVQWLAKATYDRWMVSIGKPQQFGTQGSFSINID